MTDMLCWLQQVWLLVVASTLIQATIRLFVVTKCLSCLPTFNHKLSISHSASNWTCSATDVYGTEQLYMSCCMPWDFITCRVQQIETTMWQLTGETSNQVMWVFSHITNTTECTSSLCTNNRQRYYIHCTPQSLLCTAAMAVQATCWCCGKDFGQNLDPNCHSF